MRFIHSLCLFEEIADDLIIGLGVDFLLQPVKHLLNIILDLNSSRHAIGLSYYKFIILWIVSDKKMPYTEKQEITVAAHCLLNPLTRVRGLAPLPFRPEGPTVQLPCPEALYLGMERWAATRNQLDVPQFRRFCRELLTPYADLLQMLTGEGVILRIVGAAGSPSCGVTTTSSGYTGGRVRECEHVHVAGRGVFMEELLAELERRGVPFRVDEVGKKEGTGGDS